MHWRSGSASWTAATAASAARRSGNGPRNTPVPGPDPPDDGQPRERLLGQPHPQRPLGEPGAAVVPRLVLGDQPQLADGRLEVVRARDRVDPLGQRDHLGDPAALLAGGEVAAHPAAQVVRRADVERLVARAAEEVDARPARDGVGEVPLAQPVGIDLAGEPGQLLQRRDAERAEPLEQPVQHVDGGPGVVERPVRGGGGGGEERREGGQLAVGHLVAGQQPPGQDGGVDGGGGRPGDAGLGAGGLEEAEVERRVVGDQDGAAGELEEAGQHGADARRGRDHHRGDAGQHADVGRDRPAGVDQGLELAEHLAAADLHRADLGDRAVLRRAAGRLEVDDDERHVRQPGPELLDRHLLVARDCGGEGHGPDARSG